MLPVRSTQQLGSSVKAIAKQLGSTQLAERTGAGMLTEVRSQCIVISSCVSAELMCRVQPLSCAESCRVDAGRHCCRQQ